MIEDTGLTEKKSKLDFVVRSVAKTGFSFFVKAVDKCAPDRLLLFGLNFLDKRVPNKAVSFAIKSVERLAPRRLIAKLIVSADEYVPDEVANSRKVCAVLAGIGKYIPDEMIPVQSLARWENLRAKFHIPRLISHRQG